VCGTGSRGGEEAWSQGPRACDGAFGRACDGRVERRRYHRCQLEGGGVAEHVRGRVRGREEQQQKSHMSVWGILTDTHIDTQETLASIT
jgi:hypothetical protein